MLPQCFIGGCETWNESYGVAEVVDHFKTIHGAETVNLASKMATLKLKFDESKIDVKTKVIKVPLIIEYDGIHLLFVVTRCSGRHYFWFYFVEDGVLSEGRQFHAELNLMSCHSSASMKKSEGQIIIHPITTSIDKIFKDAGKLHFVGDKGLLAKFIKDKYYQFEFTLKELPRKVILPFEGERSASEEETKKEEKEDKVVIQPAEVDKYLLEIEKGEENKIQEEKAEVTQQKLKEIQPDTEILTKPEESKKLKEIQPDTEILTKPEESKKLKEIQPDPEILAKPEESKKLNEKQNKANDLEENLSAYHKTVSVACPVCKFEFFKMSTKAKVTITVGGAVQSGPEASNKQERGTEGNIIFERAETGKPGRPAPKVTFATKEANTVDDLVANLSLIAIATTTEIMKPNEPTSEKIDSKEKEIKSGKQPEEASKIAEASGSAVTPEKKGCSPQSVSKLATRSIYQHDSPKKEVSFSDLFRPKLEPVPTSSTKGNFVMTLQDLEAIETFKITTMPFAYSNPERFCPSYRRAPQADKEKWTKIIREEIGRPDIWPFK